MASKKINLQLKLERIHTISTDFYTQDNLKNIEINGEEENVDIRVFNLMESLYPDNSVIAQKKKSKDVYKYIKSKQKTGAMGRSLLHYSIILVMIVLI